MHRHLNSALALRACLALTLLLTSAAVSADEPVQFDAHEAEGNLIEASSYRLRLGLSPQANESSDDWRLLDDSLQGLSLSKDADKEQRLIQTTGITLDWSKALKAGQIYILGTFSYIEDGKETMKGQALKLQGLLPGKANNTLVDVKIGYDSGANWEAAFFVDNLTDEETGASPENALILLVPGSDVSLHKQPRTVGVSAKFNF